MFTKCNIALRIMALPVALVLYAMPAIAEGQRPSDPVERSEPSKIPRAPIGHRQPTAADIPKDLPKDPAEAERTKRERELDAKLQICRNC